MIEPKLITILKTFSKDEIKRLGKFLKSPYFNNERDFDPLYNILKKHHPDFPADKLTDKVLFKKLYPGKKFITKKSSTTIRVLFSQMIALVNKFLACERLNEEDAHLMNSSMGAALRKKRLFKLAFQKEILNLEALASSEKNRDYFHHCFRTNQSLSSLAIALDDKKVNFWFEKNNLLYLYTYFFQNMVDFLNNARVSRYNFNFSYKGEELINSFVSSFDAEIFDRECEDDGSETKSIALCNYYVLKSHLDVNDKESLLRALEYYYKFFPFVSNRIQFNYYTNLCNLLIGKRYRLDRIYAVKANELTDFVWGKGILGSEKNAYLGVVSYTNTFRFKSYLLKSDELRRFIDTYTEKVAPEFRDELKNYSMAQLCFIEKKFGKCLEYAAKKNSLGRQFITGRYKLMICSLFEVEMFEEALYMVDALEHYILRTKSIGPVVRQDLTDFVKAFRYLAKIKWKGCQYSAENFAKIIEITKHTIFCEWFSEKIRSQYQTNEF